MMTGPGVQWTAQPPAPPLPKHTHTCLLHPSQNTHTLVRQSTDTQTIKGSWNSHFSSSSTEAALMKTLILSIRLSVDPPHRSSLKDKDQWQKCFLLWSALSRTESFIERRPAPKVGSLTRSPGRARSVELQKSRQQSVKV